MEFFSQKLLSIYFIALPVITVLLFATKILRHLTIEKTIQALDKLSDDRKERITRLYGNIISTYRIALWITPFGFLFFLAALILLFVFPDMASAFPDTDIRRFVLLTGILFVVAYIHFLEDSYYKKKILNVIDKSRS